VHKAFHPAFEMPAPFETGQSLELAPGEPRRRIPRDGDQTVRQFDRAVPELNGLGEVRCNLEPSDAAPKGGD
jgi:hypothetical protein